ncbi:uncharacterized protein LOC116267297 [Nymphaea colorata]|uniref:uncharacterized protein LOC116267297 n=1 Tax=Nymphaea colorata TaxID=210225 RepID=UPI00129E2335|nr:uncharacterized protein LOC116267297 [Nymphaea colorata]
MAAEDQIAVGDRGQLSPSRACWVHLVCCLPLAFGFLVTHKAYGWNFTTHYWQTTALLWVSACPFVLLAYSLLRRNRQSNSFYRAIGRGLLALPAGALLNASGAIILGAPIGFQYFTRTLNWSLLMSFFTVVPAASVYGWSWSDWKRIFAHFKPSSDVDYTVCLPAHGAILGAWFGAWPMPLDWERPWQEWPICVTYGAITGYLLGSVASLISILALRRGHHVKTE